MIQFFLSTNNGDFRRAFDLVSQLQFSFNFIVLVSNYVMQSEVEAAYLLLSLGQVIQIFIICVINRNSEGMILFEEKIHLNRCDKLWVETVFDDLSSSYFSLTLKKNTKCIGLGSLVHVW